MVFKRFFVGQKKTLEFKEMSHSEGLMSCNALANVVVFIGF